MDFLYNYLCKGNVEKAFTYKDIRTFLRYLLKKLRLPKLCFYLLKIDEINDCDHSLFQKFLNVLKMYQEITLQDQEKFFRNKKIEDCADKHKHDKEEQIINNLMVKNSFNEKIMSPSYYSGNLFTLSDEKKKKILFDTENSSYDNDLWLDSINY